MAKALLKPRWEAWENACIQTAFTQKIPHKTMAVALGRTTSAVSKKIKTLGLRIPSRTPGRIKGQKQTLPKPSEDRKKMIKILKTYAPLHGFQEGSMALKQGFWSKNQPIVSNNNNRTYCCCIKHLHFPFSFVTPLDFIPSTEPIPKKTRDKTLSIAPAYVSLCYVEQWANSEGFQKVTGSLRQRGITYWKEGIHYSQTQLLMYVNSLRFEHNLQPLILVKGREESMP